MTAIQKRWRYRLLPHHYASIPQPRWYDAVRYAWARYVVLDGLEVTFFPKLNRGAQYVCGHCPRTFPDHYTRNVHEWAFHPGCPKNRIPNFWRWVFSESSWKHCCKCGPGTCDRGCSPCELGQSAGEER